jgi:hypothetical protein
MKNTLLILSTCILFVISCSKVNPSLTNKTEKEATLNNEQLRPITLNTFYTRGVHTLSELDEMRANPNNPVALLSDQSYTLFKNNLQIYRGIVVGYRNAEINTELSGASRVKFYQLVIGMNPPSDEMVSIDITYPTYSTAICIDNYKWDGDGSTKDDCIKSNQDCCCYKAKQATIVNFN